MKTELQRFEEKYRTDGPFSDLCESQCWQWTAASTRGRGVFKFNGKQGYAAIYSYLTFVGEIPDGYQIDHLCYNPVCVNPDHLEAVTPEENYRRGREYYSLGEYAKECPNGHEYTDGSWKMQSGFRRCIRCIRANNQRSRPKDRERYKNNRGRLDPDDPRHGKMSTYSTYSCRCELCRKSQVEYNRLYYLRTKEKT